MASAPHTGRTSFTRRGVPSTRTEWGLYTPVIVPFTNWVVHRAKKIGKIGQDETVSHATSLYVDDIFVNKSVCSAAQVKRHLEPFGLTCKNPEQLSSGARVLGVYVWEEHGKLRWRRDGERPKVPNVLTRCAFFSVCGRLTGHFPVCGWLRVAAAFVKRRANAVTTGWDDKTQDPMLRRMLDEIVIRSSQTDPARGDWCVDGQEVTV